MIGCVVILALLTLLVATDPRSETDLGEPLCLGKIDPTESAQDARTA
jgi:hypothetical protein